MRVKPFRVALAAVSLLAGLMSAGAASPAAKQTYIVVLDGDAQNVPAVAADLATAHGGRLGFIYEHAIKGFSVTVTPAAAAALAQNPLVSYVEADREFSVDAQTVPTGITRIFAEQANYDGLDSRVDVDVAVIDTGVDWQHPELNVVAGINCAQGNPFRASCSGNGDDDHYHGTHVAGTIAAIDNGTGVVGVAPGARIHAVKVLNSSGSGYTSWIVAGIDWVTARASTIEVANMSLGGSGFSQAQYDAIQRAVNAGVAFAVAAGNSDADASGFSPAGFNNVLTVSALADFDGKPDGLGSSTCRTDQDDTLANFSNWGSAVDIAAPGVCILSTFPIEQGSYGTISGTSMASPHAAGALALLAGANNPNSATAVHNLYQAIRASGNFDWTDDSGDGIQEPLLDLGGTGGGDPDNNPPVALDDDATTNEDTAVPIEVLANDSDPDADTLTVSSVSNPPKGSATTNGTMVTYTPDANTNGTDSFSYTVSDGRGGSDISTVTVTVTPVNDDPVANDDAATTDMDTQVIISVLANDTDVDGNSLTVSLVSDPPNGNATTNGMTVTYTPDSGFTGSDSFTYTISDGNSGFDTAMLTVTVTNPNAENLVPSSQNNGSTWTAMVTNSSGGALSGTWSYSGGSASCDGVDTCSLSGIPKRQGSVTFTSSTGNSVVVNKP